MTFEELSPHAEELLQEILDHRNEIGKCESDYWKGRFSGLEFAEDVRLRSLFEELEKDKMIFTQWADGYPYVILLTDKGLSYNENKKLYEKQAKMLSSRERSGMMLTERDKEKLTAIKEKFRNSNVAGFSPDEFQQYRTMLKRLEDCEAITFEMKTLDGTRHYSETGSIEVFEAEENEEWREQEQYSVRNNRPHQSKKYDVFISHANKDKSEYVDLLYTTIKKLGVNVFYDTAELSWGDNWKEVILNGTEQSEFAIIVISENFFGREWTERELNEFLKRQNASGQKIVLPLLHNITIEDLKKQYPQVADIQAIDTERYSKEDITILFAKELIKRLK